MAKHKKEHKSLKRKEYEQSDSSRKSKRPKWRDEPKDRKAALKLFHQKYDAIEPTTAEDIERAIADATQALNSGPIVAYDTEPEAVLEPDATPVPDRKVKKSKTTKVLQGVEEEVSKPMEKVEAWISKSNKEKLVVPTNGEGSEAGGNFTSTKSKKSKKRKSEDLSEAPEVAQSAPEPTSTTVPAKVQAAQDEGASKSKSPRFIAFIGNLPFNTTTASLERHFASIRPDSIRHRTEKDVDGKAKAAGKEPKSKGYAFIEFSSYDRMLTCLKLYHHSLFSVDGDVTEETEGNFKGKNAARRINVELTAGGGGKSQGRREKLRLKNEKLGVERERRVIAEKAKKEEEGKAGNKTKKVTPAKPGMVNVEVEAAETLDDGREGMHPSRMAMIESNDVPADVNGFDGGHRGGGLGRARERGHGRGRGRGGGGRSRGGGGGGRWQGGR